MGKKRFYDAVRDLIREVHDPPEPSRSKRRLSISSLLAAPQTCGACWETVSGVSLPFCCHDCLGVLCMQCLLAYARAGLSDRSVLPLRCAHVECRAPVPLSALRRVLSDVDLARLARFQCEVVRCRPGLDGGGDGGGPGFGMGGGGVDMHEVGNSDVVAMEDVVCTTDDADGMDSEPARTSIRSLAGNQAVATASSNRSGPSCDDGEEMLLALMGSQGWQRCPECGMCIERTTGCPHMVCVCGGEFCYACGERWGGGGLGCPRRCGLPADGDDMLLTLLPGRFDELREELWQRFTALLQTFREHLDRGEGSRRGSHGGSHGDIDLDEGGRGHNSRGGNRNANRSEGRPVKMRLRSLVHPSRENRL